MPNYKKGKIYKLIFDGSDEIYVGSTIQALKDRLSGHRSNPNNFKIRKAVRDHGRYHVKIRLIEKYPCDDRDELLKREQYWIDELKPSMNEINAVARPKHLCIFDELCQYHLGCKECAPVIHKFTAVLNELRLRGQPIMNIRRKEEPRPQESDKPSGKLKSALKAKTKCDYCNIEVVNMKPHLKSQTHIANVLKHEEKALFKRKGKAYERRIMDIRKEEKEKDRIDYEDNWSTPAKMHRTMWEKMKVRDQLGNEPKEYLYEFIEEDDKSWCVKDMNGNECRMRAY